MKIGGKEINNWWLVGGAAGVVAAVYLYKRAQGGQAAASSTTDPNAVDPVTGMPYSQDNQVDPITGLTYLQEAQTYGSVTAAEQMVTSGSAFYGVTGGSSGVASGYPTVTGMTSSGTGTTVVTYANNAAWSQAVQQGLAGIGYDPQTVAAALGAFFAHLPLTADQSTIIQAAEAEFGPPPQGDYTIIPQPTGGTTQPPPPPAQTGEPQEYDAPSGGHIITKSSTSFELGWNEKVNTVGGAARIPDSFQVRVWQTNGKMVWDHRVTAPIDNVFGLHPGYQYIFKVWANGGKQAPPGWSGNVTLPK